MSDSEQADFFSEVQLGIVRFCSEECERQNSGERSVFHYVLAWCFVIDAWDPPDKMPLDWLEQRIQTIAAMVEPVKNGEAFKVPHGNYRMKPIYFRQEVVSVSLLHHETIDEATFRAQFVEGGAPWGEIPMLMAELVKLARTLEPEEWFRRFEEIHPFIDGNGRVGALVYNWLRGSLRAPIMAPDYWS